jgi:hypothetical protein
MEKADFLQKPIELALSSQRSIEELWRIGTEVSRLYAPIASIFSSFFTILFNTILQLGFNKAIYEFTLTRFDLLFPYDLWTKRATPLEEETLATEPVKPNVSFHNLLLVRRLASEVASRIVKQTPKPTLLPTTAARLKPEAEEEVGAMPSEAAPEKTLVERIADLQSELGSKIAPSMMSLSSAFMEYERQAVPLAFFAAMRTPSLLDLTGFEGVPAHRFAAPTETVTPAAILAEPPLAESSRALPPHEAMHLGLTIGIRLSDTASRSFGYAAELPVYIRAHQKSIIAEGAPLDSILGGRFSSNALQSFSFANELPLLMLERQKLTKAETGPLGLTTSIRPSSKALRSFSYATKLPAVVSGRHAPFLRIATTLSRILARFSQPTTSVTGGKPYLLPAAISETPPSMPLSQIDLLMKETSPSLTSWIYGESEILRGTGVSLSAVPIAASTAEKILTETLTQPILTTETPPTYGDHERVSQIVTPTRYEAGAKRGAVEAFRLPLILTSLAASYAQAYTLPLAEPAVGEIYETSLEVGRVSTEQPKTPRETLEEKKFSRLPVVLALASAESLITQRLQHELTAFTKEIQTTMSTYGEAVTEIGTAGPIRATMLSELASSPTLPPTLIPPHVIETYTPRAPPVPPPLSRPSPLSSTIQNTINLTVSAETAEEDLRDLERKISRILSEQISRYYGSSRI